MQKQLDIESVKFHCAKCGMAPKLVVFERDYDKPGEQRVKVWCHGDKFTVELTEASFVIELFSGDDGCSI